MPSDEYMGFRPQYGDEGLCAGYIIFSGGDPHPQVEYEAGLVVAGRYLVESRGRLLMVQRVVSPGPEHGTVSFRIFRLRRETNGLDWSWERINDSDLMGTLLFVGRGCSRAIETGRSGLAFIYFLDDAEGFPADLEATIHAENQQLYRRDDAGWFRKDTGYVEKSWPKGPSPDCSPWIWFHH
ncbi:hypothetical protein U9M48_044933 [Paspalum notatum var. saurae]|uniref:KIB1-4 beta-propeller domain-containing protein n=1 Tax=Paspalum notatum var. saurae TaxID=547442 RepID=A0AAQ3XIU3_PASNO